MWHHWRVSLYTTTIRLGWLKILPMEPMLLSYVGGTCELLFVTLRTMTVWLVFK